MRDPGAAESTIPKTLGSIFSAVLFPAVVALVAV